jgi:hypothetical protein
MMEEIKTFAELTKGDKIYTLEGCIKDKKVCIKPLIVKDKHVNDYGHYHSTYQQDIRYSIELLNEDGTWNNSITIKVTEAVSTIFDGLFFTVKEEAVEHASALIDEEIKKVKKEIKSLLDIIADLNKCKESLNK